MREDLKTFLDEWRVDPAKAKPAFMEFYNYLSSLPGVELDFKPRPGVTWSLRAKNAAQKKRDVFILVDVVDDDPANRWLSVCFYADMITDPEEVGDFVPKGLLGEDARCFNIEDDESAALTYALARAAEAAESAAR